MRDSAAGSTVGRWTAGVRPMQRAVMLACALVVASASAAAAQAGEGRACFQPQPLPVCRSFWVTEFGMQYFVSQPPGIHNQRRLMGTWELGWMRNRTPDDAVGGSVFLATNDHAMRSGVRARYRRWVGAGTAVDLSPAIIVFQSDEDLETKAKLGAALQAAVSYHDWIGLTTQLEAASGGVRLQTGVRLGGWAGAGSGIGLPLAVLVAQGKDDS